MIVQFLVRNRYRRRIARGFRLLMLTQAVAPRVVNFSFTIIRAYVRAWRGNAG